MQFLSVRHIYQMYVRYNPNVEPSLSQKRTLIARWLAYA